MHRTRLILITVILLAVLAGTFHLSGVARAASLGPKITCKQWNYVNSPNPSTYGNDLTGVAAISASDVWAIGSQFNNIDNSLTLAEHYDGTQWTVVSVPEPTGSVEEDLVGIAAVSTSDVWAVGYYFDSNYLSHTLIEQWNGTAWNIIPSPDEGTTGVQLYGIAAISATNIWAVGSYQDSSFNSYTLAEQWNGATWNIVTSPNGNGQSNVLIGVTAISSSAVWAVGYESSSTLTEKWNGTAWNIVSSASRTGSSNYLTGVVAVSSKALWAAGYSINSTTAQYSTLMEKWNGTAWKIVASPTPSSTSNLNISGIAALSGSSVWVVGWDQNMQGKTKPIIEHWNGSQWSLVSGAKVGSFQYELVGINRVPGTSTLWSVGLLFGNTGYQTITEYYC
ncbi:MAG: hypothetical protein ACYDER_09300 [Ktedonobacteraceae bacterium]